MRRGWNCWPRAGGRGSSGEGLVQSRDHGERVRLSPLLAPRPARLGQHGVGAAGREWGFSPVASRSLAPRFPAEIPRAARGAAWPGARPARAGAAVRSVPSPRSHATARGGLGWRGLAGSRLPALHGSRFRRRESERKRNPVFPRAPAFLACASGGRRVLEEAVPRLGRSRDPRARESLASRGQRDPPRVERGEGAGWGAPASVPRAQSPCGWERRPAWRRPLRFGSAAFSFFRSPWSAWVTLFYFWKAGLTQHRKKVIKRSRSFSIT